MSRLGRRARWLPLLICMPLLCIEAVCSRGAMASNDTFKITAKEKAACTTDAIRLCAHTYPDENLLLACMKSNRSSLSAICLTAFDAGMKRRHLN